MFSVDISSSYSVRSIGTGLSPTWHSSTTKLLTSNSGDSNTVCVGTFNGAVKLQPKLSLTLAVYSKSPAILEVTLKVYEVVLPVCVSIIVLFSTRSILYGGVPPMISTEIW